MGLFSSNSKPEPPGSQSVNKEAISSIIAREMHITGEINFKGKTRIDGILDGDIRGEYLILSESGRIKGNLTLDTLVCHGSIQGDIEANTITIHQTATIQGKLASGNLTVEPGASIEGEIHAVNTTTASRKPGITPKQASASGNTASTPAQGGQKSGQGK